MELTQDNIGGLEKNKYSNKRIKGTQGRSTKTKTAVVGMRSRGGKVKAKPMDGINKEKIQKRIEKSVTKNSILATDGARFYVGGLRGCTNIVVNHSVGKFVNGMASTNGIGSV